MNHPRVLTTRHGFTLVELLVVMGVLVVLISIAIGVGTLVTSGGERRATQSLLETLNRALQEYTDEVGTIPAYVPNQYIGVPGPDAVLSPEYQGVMHPRRPDAAVFIAQARGIGAVGDTINNLPERFRFARLGQSSGGSLLGPANISAEVPSIIDTWGNDAWTSPWLATQQQIIYFVHPDNSLAQDLYGQCKNGLPYFLSAGPDRLYGLNDDEFIPEPADGSGATPGMHSYATVLEAQKDNLTSYPIDPITRSAFERTNNAGVR